MGKKSAGKKTETAGSPDIGEIGEKGAVEKNSEAARKAILENVLSSCGSALSEAIDIQARHSAGFMSGKYCQKGRIGAEFTKTMTI
jgi:hypothetical protein